jgi:hypothetical protein
VGSIFADVSVLVRQKKGRRAAVGFRDNPELYSVLSGNADSRRNPSTRLNSFRRVLAGHDWMLLCVEEGHDGSEQVVLRPVAQPGFLLCPDVVDDQVPALQVLHEFAARIREHEHIERTFVREMGLVGNLMLASF